LSKWPANPGITLTILPKNRRIHQSPKLDKTHILPSCGASGVFTGILPFIPVSLSGGLPPITSQDKNPPHRDKTPGKDLIWELPPDNYIVELNRLSVTALAA
jgi:hypothetical protein